MDKPVTLSLKAWIIRNMSVSSQIQESLIETVINHQFDSAFVALNTCNTLEFSGFGRLVFNTKKAYKKLEKYESQLLEFDRIMSDPSISLLRRRNMQMKKDTTTKNIEYLNTRLNEYTSNLRRVEKQIVPSNDSQGIDTNCNTTKNEDM